MVQCCGFVIHKYADKSYKCIIKYKISRCVTKIYLLFTVLLYYITGHKKWIIIGRNRRNSIMLQFFL